jgi:YfiR/HmsC-like
MALLRRLLFAVLSGLVLYAGDPSLEYQVKAAFLYNFARFAEWPPEAIARTNSIGICVLGRDPFGTALEQTFRDKVIKGRPFSVRRLTDAAALNECHLLFYSSVESAAYPVVLRNAAHAGILTVGDALGFIEAGGMIEFVLAENKVRFKINPDATQRAHIRLSAQLLQLAWVVHDSKGRGE